MRDNWQTVRLGDLCTIKGRIGFRGYTRQDLVEKGEGAITLSPSNIVDDKLNLDKCQYISWFKYDESPEIMIFEGDIIYAKTASIGKVALVKDLPEKATINPQFVVFKNIKCNRSFLYYAVRSHGFKEQVSLITNGVAIPTVSQSNLEKLHIKLPSVSEQQRIVDELDLLTGIIDKKNAQLRDLDALAQSIFYEMFGDPITNEKGWPIKNVGEFADVTDYVANGSFATLRKNVSYKSEPDYAILVRLADFSNAFDRRKFVYVDKHAYDFLAKSKLFGGEIIMSNVGSVGKSFICPDLGQPMSLAPNSIVIKTPNNIYSYACFQMPSFQLAIKGITSQTALPKFNKTEFKKIKVICPPAEMQTRYEVRWKAIQGQRERIKASLKDAQALLDSRMDYYFND